MYEIKKIGIYTFPDVEELDFVGAYEILAKSRKMHSEGKLPVKTPLQVDIIATEDLIRCSNGMLVKPHIVATNFEQVDLYK